MTSTGCFSALRRSIELRRMTSSRLGGSGTGCSLVGTARQARDRSLEVHGQLADERAHLGMLRLEVDPDAVVAQGAGGQRADGGDDDAPEQHLGQRGGQAERGGDLPEVANLD